LTEMGVSKGMWQRETDKKNLGQGVGPNQQRTEVPLKRGGRKKGGQKKNC